MGPVLAQTMKSMQPDRPYVCGSPR